VTGRHESHRDFTQLAAFIVDRTVPPLSVGVEEVDESLSVSNPGGFIEGVTIENLLAAEPHGRKPVLADAHWSS